MELERVDTKRAYERIRAKIATLEMGPGEAINEQALARELATGVVPVREALKLLVHENLVVITPRHGIYVADVNVPDLERISEMRLALEGLSARLAAARATEDDLVVLEALRRQQAAAMDGATDADRRHLIDVDHKFHQAVAKAAHNKYLAEALERLFGLSQRLWYLALPQLEFLAPAVEKHLNLVTAIREGNGDQAEAIMRDHVAQFYDKMRDVLANERMSK
jgi:DNA-binding GntR family transcriptional regulator